MYKSQYNFESNFFEKVDYIDKVYGLPAYSALKVQKCNLLYDLLFSNTFGLKEFKLLDFYLGRVNSKNLNRLTVVVTASEMAKILNVSQLLTSNTDNVLKRLKETVFLRDLFTLDPRELVNVQLFETARLTHTFSNMRQIELKCNKEAMTYLFAVEKYGYYSYSYDTIRDLKSIHTYLLLNYILKNWMNGIAETWVEDADTLKKLLRCDTIKSYSGFDQFYHKILKPASEEVSRKCALNITIMPLRNTKRITRIGFTVKRYPWWEEKEKSLRGTVSPLQGNAEGKSYKQL